MKEDTLDPRVVDEKPVWTENMIRIAKEAEELAKTADPKDWIIYPTFDDYFKAMHKKDCKSEKELDKMCNDFHILPMEDYCKNYA